MPKGRPQKWVTATISEPIALGKAGIEIVIYQKRKTKRIGRAIIRVGGVHLYSYKAKKSKLISWDKLLETVNS